MNSIQEVWLPVVGYDGYQVSNLGKVKRKDGKGILRPHTNKKGYLVVGLRGLRNDVTPIHKIVALTFLGPRPYGMQINHIDGRKTNNAHSNLEYVTCKENVKHAHKMGLAKHAFGESHGSAKLTESEVIEIRKLIKTHTQKQIAEMYSVKEITISNIKTRKTWKHLE